MPAAAPPWPAISMAVSERSWICQHAHGHNTEAFGFLVHLDGGALVSIEVFPVLKALEIVEERGAHIGVAHHLLKARAAVMETMPVTMMMNGTQTSMTAAASTLIRRYGHEQGDWRKNRIEELRQEQFKEALNLFNTFAGGLHHIRGLDAGFVGRAECHHFAVQLGAPKRA